MLDFSQLQTPAEHGDTLVAPEPTTWPAMMRTNHAALRSARTKLLGRPLARWRCQTREAIAGSDDRPVVVSGHQPGFFHPGVWAKHIVTARFADAIDGVAIDLVVDNDAANATILRIPTLDSGALSIASVPFAEAPAGYTYEQIPRRTAEELEHGTRAVRNAMGPRYRTSPMPLFLSAAAATSSGSDWVDQMVAARRSVEAQFGVVMQTHRVSTLWCTPLVVDMLLHAPRFAGSYNRALSTYRRANGIRDDRRPIPDLLQKEDRYEVPLWAHRANQPRRRVFAARCGDMLRLFADDAEVGQLGIAGLDSCERLAEELERCDGWSLRPRALTLTMWARLLLADLFIHGIGGAKYDRISDTIIGDYYGLAPPSMVCVSATLHLGLPTHSTTAESVSKLRHTIRDMKWNPQRHLDPTPELRPLCVRKARAFQESMDLRRLDARNHDARREVFERIRGLNQRLLEQSSGARSRARTALASALEELRQNRISRGREYFFGLYGRSRLEQLTAALPARNDFRV